MRSFTNNRERNIDPRQALVSTSIARLSFILRGDPSVTAQMHVAEVDETLMQLRGTLSNQLVTG
jgi:hypothetical protein